MDLRRRDRLKKLLRKGSARLPVKRPCKRLVERLEDRLMLSAEMSPLQINLNIGNDLAGHVEARAAFQRAADFWESVLFDPVVVNIDADFTDGGFPNDNTLATSSSTMVRFLYGDVRSRLIADASADEAIVAQLPAPEQLSFDLATGIIVGSFGGDVAVELTRANALALGYTNLPDNKDATITFNSRFDFDFDNSDGVDAGQFDFEALAVHEIGHALGFVSNVDDVDLFVSGGGGSSRVDPMVLDLFRLAPAQGALFTSAPRILNTGAETGVPVQVFHDGQFDVSPFADTKITGLGTGDIPLATGTSLGDGRQASHFKDNDATGVLLGLLDPVFSRATVGHVTENDLRVLGLIGWDWHDTELFGTPPSVTVDMQATIDSQPAISGTISETDAEVLVRLPSTFGDNNATLFIDGDPEVSGAFRLANAPTSRANISRVEIILPRAGFKQQGSLAARGPYFNTAGLAPHDFQADSTAGDVGLLSPESDEDNDGDVADWTKTLTLTFDDFEPGESLSWQIDVDGDRGSSVDGRDLVGGRVHVFFDDGTSTSRTLQSVGGNFDASAAVLSVQHALRATNHGDGTWSLAAGSFDPLTPGAYEVAVTATDSSGAQATNESGGELIVFPPDVSGLPRVEAIYARSTAWSGEILSVLGPLGVVLAAGPDQSLALPWSGLEEISVRFSQNVFISDDDLRLSGVNQTEYNAVDFRYDEAEHVATWTLAKPIQADKLLLELSSSIHDDSMKPLDGNWTNGTSVFPSGNGTIDSGDRFAFRMNVLPGDTDGDGRVTRRDVLDVLFRLPADSASDRYDPRFDLSGDGQIDVDDLRRVVYRLGAALPSGEPAGSSPSAPQIATDAFFSRLGVAAAPQDVVVEPDAFAEKALPAESTVARSRPLASSEQPRRVQPSRRALRRQVAHTTLDIELQDTSHGDARQSAVTRRIRARRR